MPDKSEHNTLDVIISGGGPVGLLLGIFLSQKGVSNLILEKNTGINSHSRSIGIHPPSLHTLQRVGLDEAFTEAGCKIPRGHAMADSCTIIGTLSFDQLPQPYQFVLTMPQNRTEEILEAAAGAEGLTTLIKGDAITDFKDSGDYIEVTADNGKSYYAQFLAGCDGKNSTIRKLAGIEFPGEPYPYSYVMGDFADETDFGDDTVVFTGTDGLVESFPLPGGMRRWVLETGNGFADYDAEDLLQLLNRRTGIQPSLTSNTMLSNFGTERFLADTFHQGRVILAGDAAHVVSPIGGQGMNLGWLDAADLADKLEAILKYNEPADKLLQQYARHRRKCAKEAIRRSEFNMMLGHKSRFAGLRNFMLKAMLKTPVKRILARRFTMYGLD